MTHFCYTHGLIKNASIKICQDQLPLLIAGHMHTLFDVGYVEIHLMQNKLVKVFRFIENFPSKTYL